MLEGRNVGLVWRELMFGNCAYADASAVRVSVGSGTLHICHSALGQLGSGPAKQNPEASTHETLRSALLSVPTFVVNLVLRYGREPFRRGDDRAGDRGALGEDIIRPCANVR